MKNENTAIDNNEAPAEREEPRKGSHESLLGTILFLLMIIFTLLSIAGVGWAAYSKWVASRDEARQPSIAALEEKKDEKSEALPAQPDAAKTENQENKTAPDAAGNSADTKAKDTPISVLNGGAAKGSAGIVADILKKDGYAKVTAGNTLGDYVGVTVYHAAGSDKEAQGVQSSLLAKYPQAKLLPADAKNKETSVSQITVILGK